MEPLVILASLSIFLCVLPKPNVAVQVTVVEKQSTTEQACSKILLPLPTTLPRKLRILEQVKAEGIGGEDSNHSYKEGNGDISGKPHRNRQDTMMHGNRGTWKEWVEKRDSSEYFTMDYSQVRRRRPIHNKSLHLGP